MLSLSVALLAALALLAPAFSAHLSLAGATLSYLFEKMMQEIKDVIYNGDSENGIPVLDPLMITFHQFAVIHDPVGSANGYVWNMNVTGLGDLVMEKSKVSFLMWPPRAFVTLAVRFPKVRTMGEYMLKGEAHIDTHTDYDVHGDGNFTAYVRDFTVETKTVVTLLLKVMSVDVTMTLGDIYVEVDGAGDVGEIINNEAATRIEQWFADNRSGLEKEAADEIKKVIHTALGRKPKMLDA